MKNIVKRCSAFIMAVVVLSISIFPTSPVRAYMPDEYFTFGQYIPQSNFSAISMLEPSNINLNDNAIYSMLAAGGISVPLGLVTLNEWTLNYWQEHSQNMQVQNINGRNVLSTTYGALNRFWDDWLSGAQFFLDMWHRDGNQIRTVYANVIGELNGVPVLNNAGAITSPVIGPQVAHVGNRYFYIRQENITMLIGGIGAYPGVAWQIWDSNGNFVVGGVQGTPRHTTINGIVFTQNPNGTLAIRLSVTETLTDGWHGPIRGRVSRLGPGANISIPNPIIQPPPPPIILRPVNIIDQRNDVRVIIREISNVECDDCPVFIWLPDHPRDLIDRPIIQIVIPPPKEEPCPIDPQHPCNCPEDLEAFVLALIPCPIEPENPCYCPNIDEDGFITRIIDRFIDLFSNENDDSGWFSWPSLPSFSWPDMPNWFPEFPSLENIVETVINGLFSFIEELLKLFDLEDFTFNFQPFYDFLDNLPDFSELFPFSLPHDLYNLVRVIAGHAPMETIGMSHREATAFIAMQTEHYNLHGITPTFINTEAPMFEMHLPEPFNYTFVFDMNDYPQMISLIRWSTLVIFAIGMIKITTKVVSI